jgi:peptidoglycan-associated lipoprotein
MRIFGFNLPSWGNEFMRLMIITAVLAVALAGCETTQEDTASALGNAQTNGVASATTGASGSAPMGSVTAQPMAPSDHAGSVEDFVVNVGDRVFFAFDRYDLSDEARDTIERQAAWLKRYPQVTITVEGHADERGTREYNLALGERRATTVRDYLIALGIGPNRIHIISYGKERPFDTRSNEAAWAKNRRGVTVVDRATVTSLTQ